MKMPSQESVRLVWNGLLDADRLHRYYGYLAGRLESTERLLSWACIVLTSGTVVTALSNHPYWASTLGALATGFNIYLLIAKLSKRTWYSASRQQRFSELLVDWEKLWSELSSMEDDEIRRRWNELSARANAITENCAAELPLNKKIHQRSAEEAYSVRALQHSPQAT